MLRQRPESDPPRRLRFIPPALPKRRSEPPAGGQWLHEVKFDGWRLQLHKEGSAVALYTKNGHNYERRLRQIADRVRALPATSFIIDAELTASDEHGRPDFRALLRRKTTEAPLCVWGFDLLHLDGADLRQEPLVERKARLSQLLAVGAPLLRYAESFDDGAALLRAAEGMQLEGIVSKRRDAPYRSGIRTEWVKVKCPTWLGLHRERWRKFQRVGS
jgi:bifunctional non-homologous end joining protein LigD